MWKFRTRTFWIAAALSATVPVAAWAGFFGDHPRYVHAMGDLKTARWMISRPDAPNVTADENRAVGEIDAALGEIKQAALEDFKDVWNAPHADASMNHRGRLDEALKLLQRAHDDISQEEDDRRARGLQHRAIEHLDNAISSVRLAREDKHMDERSFRDQGEYRHF
jgi:tetratricopeptide (TPR) repeat protein